MKAVQVHEFGGLEQLRWEETAAPAPAAGEALVKIHASGVNFIDIYFRSGLYKAPLPARLGMEGAGVVEAVGPEATGVKPGDRVAYAMARGSHAEYAAVPAWQLVKLPAGVSFEQAAGALLQGMTAHYLTHSTFALKDGDTALVHAAAGGTGQWIVSCAKLRGARVIAVVGSDAKAAAARAAGADEVVVTARQDFASEARRLTGGRGVDVVYDSVGAATWEGSLNSLRPRGMMVSFGNASGAVPPQEPLVLSAKGSLFLTRPNLAHYAATREEMLWRAGDVLRWLAEGQFTLHIDRIYPMSQAALAQDDLANRRTTGKLLLVPDALA